MATQLVPQGTQKGRVIVPAVSIDGHDSPQMIIACEDGRTYNFDACGLPHGHQVAVVTQLMYDEPATTAPRKSKAKQQADEQAFDKVRVEEVNSSEDQVALFRNFYDTATNGVQKLLDCLLKQDREITLAVLRQKLTASNTSIGVTVMKFRKAALAIGLSPDSILVHYETNDLRTGAKFGLTPAFRNAVMASETVSN